jgi:hypothetical protein
MNKMDLLNILNNAMGDIRDKFQSNPLDYLYECDLQCELYGVLKWRLKDVYTKDIKIWPKKP